MANSSIFKKIDQALFTGLDKLKESPDYSKLMDLYNSLEENVQEATRGAIMLLLFAIPVAVIAIFSWSNGVLEKDLNVRKNIIATANEIIQTNKTIQNAEKKYIGKTFVDNKGRFQQLLSSASRMAGADLSKIMVGSFEKFDQAGNILQIETDIKFSALTNDQLFSFLDHLSEKNKVRFDKVSIKKNSESNLLEGIFTALYYSKEIEAEEEE